MKEFLAPQLNIPKKEHLQNKKKQSEKESGVDIEMSPKEAAQTLFDHYNKGQLPLDELLDSWRDNPNLDSWFFLKIFQQLDQKEKEGQKKLGRDKSEPRIKNDINKAMNYFSDDEDLLLPADCDIKKFIFKELSKKATPHDLGYFLNHLSTDSISNFLYRKDIADMFREVGKKHKTDHLTDKAFDFLAWGKPKYSDSEKELLIIIISDLMGTEATRDKFNNLTQDYDKTGNEDAVERLGYARSFITPNHDKIAITNLQKFYSEKIKFEDYKVNEKMNAKEVELLESLIDKNGKVLEMGCGAGRLIKELSKDGYDMTGYDYTKRHVEITQGEIKKTGQEAKVFQGDWHNNSAKDESFETVYSLGRNILHDYSIVDQAQLFREAARILKPGGKFIFDIPNREKGGYKMLVEEYAREMKERGIKNFRYGTIYDSPDGQNFATRYTYSNEDIKQLAELAGFKIIKVEKRELETGKEDENIYYVLEKI